MAYIFSKRDILWALSLVSAGVLAGLLMWFSGLDAHIQWWLNTHNTPLMNDISRSLGVVGLGRVQMFACLFMVVMLAYGTWPASTRPPLWQWPWWLLGSAALLLLRTLGGVIGRANTPLVPGKLTFSCAGLVDFSRMLPPHARAWLLAVPIMFTAGTLSLLIKISVGRPRPKKLLWEDVYDPQWFVFSAGYWSFPSGHTVTTFAILAVLWPLYPRAKWALLMVAVMLAVARVTAVTPHFVGDILAGAALGYTMGWLLRKKYKLELF